jgi:hypothetical protein
MVKRRSKETPEEKGGGSTAGLQKTSERFVTSTPRADTQGDVPQPETDRWGDNELLEGRSESRGAFSPGVLGEPDRDPVLGAANAPRTGGDNGPLGQDGQGNRQADELAEMEQIEPDLDLDGPKDR